MNEFRDLMRRDSANDPEQQITETSEQDQYDDDRDGNHHPSAFFVCSVGLCDPESIHEDFRYSLEEHFLALVAIA